MSEDIELPRNVVSRIAKAKLPETFILSKDAKISLSYAGGVFVLYLSSIAQDICNERGRSTITQNDIYDALKDMGFEDMNEPLKAFIAQWKGGAKGKSSGVGRRGPGRKPSEAKDSNAKATSAKSSRPSVEGENADSTEPPAKSARVGGDGDAQP